MSGRGGTAWVLLAPGVARRNEHKQNGPHFERGPDVESGGGRSSLNTSYALRPWQRHCRPRPGQGYRR